MEGQKRALFFAEAQVSDAEIVRLLCHENPIKYGGRQNRAADRAKRHAAVAAKVGKWTDELENARALGRATVRRQLYELRNAEGGAGVTATVAMAREMGASEGMDRDVARALKRLRDLDPDQIKAEIERWAASIA